ncbi:VWA domain-containing protein [Ponticaulis sp.]|uniref:VWA domain-containing protein n=1 Tax=Ponticaulis sp. TaxID=2020902 RepID=UPI000B71C278|nr:VWA domain-containing protein [Ponticaulis sp.]MAI91007.1 hypothetical protein [Ponticaulis sp.]OUX98345.1 MAG: hypothetical protein CBB65_11220 [Hyphomonadaceae bacterium TMED5]|tara:strand:- start:133388 stop:134125 length:738 start_codon:yes stop_codon:yes gene_type:complete
MNIIKVLLGAAFIASATSQAGADIPEDKSVQLNSYILLDRTGSMSSIWDEALGSVNAYVDSVVTPDDGPDVANDITLSVFDAQDGLQFDTLRRNVAGDDWSEITNDEVTPRGMTPLFDAIGRMISLAEADDPEKAVIVIMTDGHENASREFTHEGVREALDRAEERGWAVVFLGAEFASFSDADAVGVNRSSQMAVSSDRLSATMSNLAQRNRGYAQGIYDDVEFSEEDRAIAQENEVIERRGRD